MSLKERESAIIEYLRENKSASVEELCRALFVSEPTMRRDLASLNSQGKIIRTYGGASYKSEHGQNLPQEYRAHEHRDAKAQIAKKCLSLINDGDVIMTDGSSTALELLRIIGTKKSIMVITNNAKAPLVLASTSVKTFVTGGELAGESFVYVGGYAEEFIRSFNADVCFFSVRTLTPDGRLTDNAIAENSVRREMMSRSKKKILMLDSGKIGEPCLNTLCTLNEIDLVVSEKDISKRINAESDKFLSV